MTNHLHMRRYQQQAVLSSSPEQLVLKLYDLGVNACVQEDRSKLRRVLTELLVGLDHERGGEIAGRLQTIYEYCMNESIDGDMEGVRELLGELRRTWKEGVLERKAA